ncbi:MAG: polyprenol phosphomannose-dependent alpha 1,6 mannosyltransferase MptB [Solirubrobacteraceae bacterium]
MSTRWGRDAWAALGFAGSLLIAFASPRALHDSVVGWWYKPDHPGHLAGTLVYLGIAALCVAWLGLGRRLPERRALLAIAALWMLPLALAPPLFSRDLYSYYAQGTILHLGVSPYHHPPVVLAGLGRGHVLAAVSPFWRHTTAPYGPLFLELVSLMVGIAGGHLIAGVLLTRALELVGIGLLALATPRLARAMGSDVRRALWLTVASPMATLGLIAAGHNDALMIGLLAAGVAVALKGRPLTGIAVCALAATIKVPALVGVVFIAVAWARAETDTGAALRLLLGAAAVTVAVIGAVTLASGVGVSWLSTSLFSTPAKVRLAITPATGAGYTVAALAHAVGIGVSSRGLEAAFGVVAFALTAVIGLSLLYRVRVGRLLTLLGTVLLVAAAGGPAAWPWYFSWGLILVAALSRWQRSRALAGAPVTSGFLVPPPGVLPLPLGSAPAVLVVYLLIAGWAWQRWRHRERDVGWAGSDCPRADSAASSALAGT